MPACFQMINRISAVLLIMFSTLLGNQMAYAEKFYRWTDSNNITHYSKQPPKGTNAELINTKTFKPVAQTQKEQKQDKADDEASEICKTAQANLKALQGEGVIKLRDEYGKQKELNKEEREAQKKRAQEAIKTYCK